MELQGRSAPASLEAERSVLGCMLLDREAVLLAQEMLVREDFYAPQNAVIFEAMLALVAKGRPVDLITLGDELGGQGTLDGIGGLSYLVELSEFVPSTANARAYMNIVGEKSTLRRLIAACGGILGDCYEASRAVPDILESAEKAIYNIAMQRGGDALEHIRPVLLRAYAQIEELYVNKGRISGVPSGFAELDALTTGFHGGEFILVAARPSMGKTAFMLNIAQHAAITAKKTVAFFSLEMPKEQLATRALCSEAHVNLQSVRQGNLHDEQWEGLARAMGPLASMNIFFDDTSSITLPELRSRCRRMQLERGLDMVMIDYLQLMNASGRHDSRQNEVSELSRQMKILALELGVPIVVGSQLSRAPQGRADHRPVLSDLRDSGAIEQDADVVMFLYRDEYYNPETEDKNIAEVILQKQRNGPLGTVRLAWNGEYTRFMNPSSRAGL
ncbi:MAG: replicative DNA helicase [Christensenellaceae bacterium]|jgi:replicative DNA helicase|nr:replicative DNA helicase [Christensenellaceae bacterium]